MDAENWMKRRFLALFLTFATAGIGLSASPLALAADDDEDSGDKKEDDDLLGGEDEETPAEKKAREEAEKKRLQEGDTTGGDEDEKEADDAGNTEEGGDPDLLGEEVGRDTIQSEGQDTAELFRKASEDFGEMPPDEEMLSWERYLEKYPNSLFRDRIEKRMEDLENGLYTTRINTDEPDRVDNDKREILFSQTLLMPSINPRTRLQAGFEWGLPDFIHLMVDYEHQIIRSLSVHGGGRLRDRYGVFDLGAHWAFVKSSRTKTIVSLLGDVRLYTNPVYFSVRPQLAFGKSVSIVDMQIQAGIEFEARKRSQLHIIGGANVTVRATEQVGIFVEANTDLKNLGGKDAGIYRWSVATIGMKFAPKLRNVKKGGMEVNIGLSAPFATNYWQPHYGSVMGQFNYFLK